MNNNTDLLKEYASLAGKEDEKSETRKTEILNYIKLHADDSKRIYDRLQEVFDTMGISQIVPIQWLYFTRIDYCTNVKMESVKAADI